jgi:glutathione S-transferase
MMCRTYADLSFVSYFYSVQAGFKEQWENWEVEKKYPDFLAWHTRLLERPSVKKILGL